MIKEPRIVVVDDVTATTCERLAGAITNAVAARGRAVLCLSGGSTPVPVFRSLAERTDLPWGRVLFAWGDERWVPHDHPDSNFRSAKEALLARIPVAEHQVMPFPYGDDPRAAAAAYAATLTERLGEPSSGSALFDLNLLGLGSDGHTASLFPGTGAALRSEVAFALETPEHGWRLTLSAATLSASREVLFAVQGEAKRHALATTWPGGPGAAASLDDYPARAISALEELLVITDIGP